MDIRSSKAVIGADSWDRAAYGKLLRGSSVDKVTIKKATDTAQRR